jgi:hypothetical protein
MLHPGQLRRRRGGGRLPRVRGYQRTRVDGQWFHSKGEARRWQELQLLLKAGTIRNLQWQVTYPLFVKADGEQEGLRLRSPYHIPITAYVADFVYEEITVFFEDDGSYAWCTVVEECKGYRTDVYKLKKKWVEALYGITIRETAPPRAPRKRR